PFTSAETSTIIGRFTSLRTNLDFIRPASGPSSQNRHTLREPVYRTLRELVMSYFEHYYNLRREKTLRNYSRPVNLRPFDRIGWMTAEEDVWAIPEHLCTIRHTPVMPSRLVPHLGRVDARLFAAGL